MGPGIGRDAEWWEISNINADKVLIAHRLKMDDGERAATIGTITFPISKADEIIKGIQNAKEITNEIN